MNTQETIDKARNLLRCAGVFFLDESDLEDEDDPKLAQTLNMNDTWAWALVFGEYVPDEALPEVAELFYRYGFCGLLYWVSERNNQMKSTFLDINRFIEFVRHEEEIRKELPESNKRAYTRRTYEIGGE